MKTLRKSLPALFLFSMFFHGQVSCHTADSTGQKYSFREKLYMTTDRDIYIAGEKMLLRIFNTDGSGPSSGALSKVIYLDVLDKPGNPAIQVKINYDGRLGSAAVNLPDTLSTGNYLIRAYTSWMQNFPEDLFGYRVISVINPFKELSNIKDSPPDDTISNKLSSRDVEPGLFNNPGDKAIELRILTDKDIYGKREKVRLDLSVTCPEGKSEQADLSVSVIKSFLSDNDLNCLTCNADKDRKNPDLSGNPRHLPEPEGLLIKGTIYNKSTDEPLKDTDISLSMVGKKARCQFMKTNSEGGFIFVLKDFTGLKEIVIQPLEPVPAGTYVELQNQFLETYTSTGIPSFRFDSVSAGLINNAVIAMQINKIYESEIPGKRSDTIAAVHNFFGNPVRTIRISDFIELSDIREVVKEIIPEVVLFRKDRQPALKVISSNPYQIFNNQALVLLDGVPVNDIDKLLSISARELESVEIINSRYFYADYVFEGIISFITKKGKLSSLEETNSFFRQVFEGCLEREDFYSPAYDSDSAMLSRIPDFRNTLFWKSDVIVTDDETAEIEFYTSDEAAEYIIVAEGFTSEGKRIRSTLPLIVK
ncbi:MAG TPA: hypothetical protein PK521_13205 [Bacteroidales bacterium]|nr:hypothetical protein [Bacteroidales bacterium]